MKKIFFSAVVSLAFSTLGFSQNKESLKTITENKDEKITGICSFTITVKNEKGEIETLPEYKKENTTNKECVEYQQEVFLDLEKKGLEIENYSQKWTENKKERQKK